MRDRLFSKHKIENNDCNVLIFGESHKEAHTIKLIHAMSRLLRLSNNCPTFYAYEFFKKYNRASAEEKHRESSEIKFTQAQKHEERINECKRLLEMCEDGSPEHTALEGLITDLQSQMLATLQEAYQECLKADYISELGELDIGYLGIDEESNQQDREELKQNIRAEQMIQERDNHMANQIARLLAENKIIIVHVGSLHVEGIVNNLLKMGVKPEKISAYIVQSKTLQCEDYNALANYFDIALSRFGKNGMDIGEILRKIERLAPYLKSDKKGVVIEPLVVNNDIVDDDYIKIAQELIEKFELSSLPGP